MKKATYLKRIGIFTLYCFLILLSLHVTIKLNARVTTATLSGDIAHAAVDTSSHQYWVYAFYNPKQSIVFPDNDMNYPEVAFVTLVAVKYNIYSGEYSLYDGEDGAIKLKMELKQMDTLKVHVPYSLINLTHDGLLELSNINEALSLDGGKANWTKFFLALGDDDIEGLKWALTWVSSLIKPSNGTNAPQNDLDISFDSIDIHPAVQVIAIKSWNYTSGVENLFLQLKNTGDLKPEICLPGGKRNIPIKLNIDNVNIVREYPFAEDPLNFVVENTVEADGFIHIEDRLYSNIIKIMMEEARGNIVLTGGGGVDWLQVAAGDIINSDTDNSVVFNCVHLISCKFHPVARGHISPFFPQELNMNPYHKDMRFNLKRKSAYGPTHYQTRVSCVYHECLHAYFESRHIIDEDDDSLVVQDDYFKFCRDSIEERSFINQNKNIKDEVRSHKEGLGGDTHKILKLAPMFVSLIRDPSKKRAIIRHAPPLADAFMKSDYLKSVAMGNPPDALSRDLMCVPQDLPEKCFGMKKAIPLNSSWIYFYNPTTKHTYLDTKSEKMDEDGQVSATIVIEWNHGSKLKQYEYGWYDAKIFRYKIASDQEFLRVFRSDKYKQLIKQGYSEVYIIYPIFYPVHPTEFCSELFALTHTHRGGDDE